MLTNCLTYLGAARWLKISGVVTMGMIVTRVVLHNAKSMLKLLDKLCGFKVFVIYSSSSLISLARFCRLLAI